MELNSKKIHSIIMLNGDDAYEELMKTEKAGLITIIRYDEMTAKKKEWLINTIKEEYKNASNHPEYRFFLKGKFAFIIDEIDKK